MATGGDPPRFPRSRGERSEAARRARAAADAAVRHARARAGELEKEVARLREVIAGLTGGVPAAEPGSWQDREAAARPALILASGGRPVPGAVRFRRNTALHAARAPAAGFAAAPRAGLAWAAAGPRLGGVLGRGAAAAVVCEVEICECEVPARPSPPAPPRRELPEAADARRTPLSSALSEQLGLLQGDLAKLSERKGALEEGAELTVELEALPQRLCALEDTAEPKAELEALSEQLGSLAGDAATGSERQGAFEECAEPRGEMQELSQRRCALGDSTEAEAEMKALSEQLVSPKGDVAALSERQGALAEGAEPTVELEAPSGRLGALEEGTEPKGEREVLSKPMNAREARGEQKEAQKASRLAFSESLFYFLDDFSVAAVLCVAIGPKTGVEALLSSAEARFLGVSPSTAGWPVAEERERILEGRLQVVQMPRGVRGPLDD
ncbi:unnamed protein product [Prorocentrum cordatum]|uniref:Uncharacterized protein n=1 Tax=Prorocentrum cordatum TaxID=2364126 RepID=A0ABN9QQ96_9DINO|nr:unnamed protein product [Polarella glacialis]